MIGKQTAVAAIVLTLTVFEGCTRTDRHEDIHHASSSASQTDVPKPATKIVLRALGGLRTGVTVEGYRVERIGAVRADGVIPIWLRSGNKHAHLVIALRGGKASAPVQTEKYAVYYEHVHRGESAPESEAQALCRGIAKWLERAEKMEPVPPGLRKLPAPARPL